MTELIDKMKLIQQIAEFGREIPKDQVIGVIARQEAVDTLPTMDRPRPIDPTITVDLENGVVPISACEPKGPKTIVYVDRRKGEWFGDKCSICGAERAWYGDTPDFCPDCGADMRGEDE